MKNFLSKINSRRGEEVQVKDVMTPKVYVLNEDDTLDVARLLMDSIHIRHIPVVNKKDAFVGLITHRDLLKLSVSSLAGLNEEEQKKLHQRIPLRDVMNQNVKTISPGDTLVSAIKEIISNKFGCLPVVDRDRLVGIITEADFVKFTYKLLTQESPSGE